MSKKFKEEMKDLIKDSSKIVLDPQDKQFVELIKDEIKKEIVNFAEIHGEQTDLIEITGSVLFSIAELHNLHKVERYFKEVEEFQDFSFMLTTIILSTLFTLHMGEINFKFKAVL